MNLHKAAEGGNVLLLAGPGSGVQGVIQRIHAGMAPPSFEDAVRLAWIYQGSGLYSVLDRPAGLVPFRAPHHTVSQTAMLGGGFKVRPGELSLAHAGVLVMYEIEEWRTSTALETLRAAREGTVSISRSGDVIVLPAKPRVILAVMDPAVLKRPSGVLRTLWLSEFFKTVVEVAS